MSWEFTVDSGRFEGVFASTYNPPFTICWFWKYTNHPAANKWAFEFTPTDFDQSPSLYAHAATTADRYDFQTVTSGASYKSVTYTAGLVNMTTHGMVLFARTLVPRHTKFMSVQ